jgi:hypothetical protein
MTAGHTSLEAFLEPNIDKVERRSAERQSVDDFCAYRWTGSGLTQERVRDISSTGLYIFTEERWQPDTLLSLTLQRQGPLEMSPERRIEVQAKVVRCGKDGVALAFVLKDDSESRQWASLREDLIEEARPEDMLSLVRLVEAVAFLNRICPAETEKVRPLLLGSPSKQKLENVVAIVLKAENLLAAERADDRQHAKPDLILRILEDGSCTDEDWLKDFWGGLLATSCAVDAKDESSQIFVESFSKLTTYLCRIRLNLR